VESFDANTTLKMKEFDINNLFNKHLDSFYINLKNIYKKEKGFSKNFDEFHSDVQLALFDMVFNLGATKLVSSFPKFNAAIKIDDFKEAAKQSHRLDISDQRNKYVEKLLQNVIAGVIIGTPIDQIKKAHAQV